MFIGLAPGNTQVFICFYTEHHFKSESINPKGARIPLGR